MDVDGFISGCGIGSIIVINNNYVVFNCFNFCMCYLLQGSAKQKVIRVFDPRAGTTTCVSVCVCVHACVTSYVSVYIT